MWALPAWGPAAISACVAGVVLLIAYDILPARLVPTFSVALPISEMLVAVALLFDIYQPATGWAAASLFSVFGVAMAANLLRGRRELPCGCFGRAAKRISWHLVAPNFALAGIGLSSTGGPKGVCMALFAGYGASALWRFARGLSRELTEASANSQPAPGD